MFKPADPNRRLPAHLQAHTKENMIWQLKLTGLLFVGIYVVEKIEERREKRRLQNVHHIRTDLIG